MSKAMSETDSSDAAPLTGTRVPSKPSAGEAPPASAAKLPPAEVGGPKGPEPTRFGDWERNGRCVDF